MKNKKGFDTTGKSDLEGRENEDNTIKILNDKKVYANTVEKRGGTKHKEDAVCDLQKIGIKRMESIHSGSHDWGNISSAVNEGLFGDTFDEFLSQVKELRQLPFDIRIDEEFKMKVSAKFDSLCPGSFNHFNSENIIKVLNRGLIEPCAENFDNVVNDIKTKNLYIYPVNRHPVFEYVNKGFTAYLKGDADKSRMIYFKDSEGNEYSTDIRMRVCNNNGIGAFLGTSKANNNSQVCIKLQQDRVGALLRLVNPTVVSY